MIAAALANSNMLAELATQWKQGIPEIAIDTLYGYAVVNLWSSKILVNVAMDFTRRVDDHDHVKVFCVRHSHMPT